MLKALYMVFSKDLLPNHTKQIILFRVGVSGQEQLSLIYFNLGLGPSYRTDLALTLITLKQIFSLIYHAEIFFLFMQMQPT